MTRADKLLLLPLLWLCTLSPFLGQSAAERNEQAAPLKADAEADDSSVVFAENNVLYEMHWNLRRLMGSVHKGAKNVIHRLAGGTPITEVSIQSDTHTRMGPLQKWRRRFKANQTTKTTTTESSGQHYGAWSEKFQAREESLQDTSTSNELNGTDNDLGNATKFL